MGGVIGDDGAFQPGITLLQRADFVLGHIHGAEAEIHLPGQLFGVGHSVQDHQLLRVLGHRRVHGPASPRGFLVGLPGASSAGGNGAQTEPGMPFQQGDKALAYHTGTADHADFIFFHNEVPPDADIPEQTHSGRILLNLAADCIIICSCARKLYATGGQMSAVYSSMNSAEGQDGECWEVP